MAGNFTSNLERPMPKNISHLFKVPKKAEPRWLIAGDFSSIGQNINTNWASQRWEEVEREGMSNSKRGTLERGPLRAKGAGEGSPL